MTTTLSKGGFFKDYKLLDVLSKGGMGEVWSAEEISAHRVVAIKFILPSYTDDEDFQRLFHKEAQTIAKLEHPSIVPIYRYGYDDDVGAFLVMRHLSGGNLKDRFTSGPQSPQHALSWLRDVCPALAYSHRNGVIHRDIKPANILFDAESRAYLTDFGIAKRSTDKNTQLTLGTPGYFAPEQTKQESVDQRADVFSLGVVIFEMLTGSIAFPADDLLGAISQVRDTPLPPLYQLVPTLDDTLNDVVQRATAKDRTDRYSGVNDLLDDFARALERPEQYESRTTPVIELKSVGKPPTQYTILVTTTGEASRIIYIALLLAGFIIAAIVVVLLVAR